ncbi:MAG: hypothetical protein HY297_01700 [Thaumarchaeota archaeon]|nr:hypothetical protein [Nitrososphaerota archaeon]
MTWKNRRAKLRSLAEGLVKVGALQFGTFTLPDGKESSYYINLKGLPSYPGVYGLVAEAVADVVSKKAPKANALCGVPITGLIIAAPVATALKMPLNYTRLSKQANERVVEGEVRPGWNVAMIDDLSRSGKSILASAKAIEQEGGDVTHAVVFIDRMEGARERLSKQGIALHCVTDVIELADTLASMELISQENQKAIVRSVWRRQ